MTREQIDNLQPGREADAIIGLALGLIHKYDPKAENECALCGCIMRHRNHAGYGPLYTTDLNETWQIVDKIKETKGIALEWRKLIGEWCCQIDPINGHSEIEAWDKSEAISVCKAALLYTIKD